MSRKTERIFATSSLDGETHITAGASLGHALTLLQEEGERQGREVLFDTLEVSIEREEIDDFTYDSRTRAVFPTIVVSAEAVRR